MVKWKFILVMFMFFLLNGQSSQVDREIKQKLIDSGIGLEQAEQILNQQDLEKMDLNKERENVIDNELLDGSSNKKNEDVQKLFEIDKSIFFIELFSLVIDSFKKKSQL